MPQYSGEVVRWRDDKGYGFVRCSDFDEELFVHYSAFGGGNLIEGETIKFDVEDDPRNPRGKKVCIHVEGRGVDPVRRPPRRDSRDRRDRYEGRGDGRRDRYDSRDRRDSRRDFDRRDSRRDDRGRDDRRGGGGRDRFDSRDRRRSYSR